MKLGAQLYTVRNFLKTPEDFDKTLAKIKEIGYNYVQVSGAFDYDAKWLDDALKRHNLTCPLTHTAPDKIIGATEKVIYDHKTFGCKYVGLGGMSLETKTNSIFETPERSSVEVYVCNKCGYVELKATDYKKF